MPSGELDVVLARLCREFPGVPRAAVSAVLRDSCDVVVKATGAPLPDKAEELTRLRLEVRTGRPARRVD